MHAVLTSILVHFDIQPRLNLEALLSFPVLVQGLFGEKVVYSEQKFFKSAYQVFGRPSPWTSFPVYQICLSVIPRGLR